MTAGRIALSIVCLALLVASVAAGAITARWTIAQASAKMRGPCVGLGKPVANRFVAFRCRPGVGGVVWAKVHPAGNRLCWSRKSLATVDPSCMVMPGRG